jgi:hypothetical protein
MLKAGEDIDSDNDVRNMHLGWLCTYNADLPEYGLPYYDRVLKNYELLYPDWRYYLVTGISKGYIAASRYDDAIALLTGTKYSWLIASNREREDEWNTLLGIARQVRAGHAEEVNIAINDTARYDCSSLKVWDGAYVHQFSVLKRHGMKQFLVVQNHSRPQND